MTVIVDPNAKPEKMPFKEQVGVQLSLVPRPFAFADRCVCVDLAR